MSIDALYQELGREFAAGLDSATFIKPAGTARLGRGTDSGEVVVLPADRQYPTFPLFWVYRESGTTTSDPFQAVPWYPGLTYDNSQRHMEVVLVQFPQIDPKLHFIFSFTDIGLAAWGGATPAQVGLQQAAAVTSDKVLMNSVYFASGLAVGFRGGSLRIDDEWYTLPANAAFIDDLTDYVPTDANKQRWVSLSINSAGTAGIVSGNEFDDSETNKLSFLPNTIPSGGYGQLQPILLSTGLTTGTDDLILPYRDLFYAPSNAGSSTAVELASLTDVTSAAQTANFVLASSGGAYEGRALIDADIPNTLTITGGSIDGAPIGGTTPAAGTFTALTVASGGNTQATISSTGAAVFNEQGNSTGDFRIEGDTNAHLFFTDASADVVGIGTDTPVSKLHVLVSDGATASASEIFYLEHHSSGTPAAGFGTIWRFRGHSSINTVRNMGDILTIWSVATDASRSGQMHFRAHDSVGARTGITITATGAEAFVDLARSRITQATLGNEVLAIRSTATNDDPTELMYQNRVATTDATVTTLHTFTVPASTTYQIRAVVTARRTGGASGTAEDGAGYEISGVYKNVAGTATQIGLIATPIGESQAAWDATLDVTGATVRVRVTGAASNNVTWHMSARVYQVST